MSYTLNKTFNLRKARGKGQPKLIHIRCKNWGSAGSGLYDTGGMTLILPEQECSKVIAPISVVSQSGMFGAANVVSWSGRGIAIIAYDLSSHGSGTSMELADNTKISGVVHVDVVAVVEPPGVGAL